MPQLVCRALPEQMHRETLCGSQLHSFGLHTTTASPGPIPKSFQGMGALARIRGSGWGTRIVVLRVAASDPKIRSVAAPGICLCRHAAAFLTARSFTCVLLRDALECWDF
jgi:hypothetical protein